MTRAVLHKDIDDLLDDLGFKDEVSKDWGSVTIEIKFEGGKEVITVVDHKTKKVKTKR